MLLFLSYTKFWLLQCWFTSIWEPLMLYCLVNELSAKAFAHYFKPSDDQNSTIIPSLVFFSIYSIPSLWPIQENDWNTGLVGHLGHLPFFQTLLQEPSSTSANYETLGSPMPYVISWSSPYQQLQCQPLLILKFQSFLL